MRKMTRVNNMKVKTKPIVTYWSDLTLFFHFTLTNPRSPAHGIQPIVYWYTQKITRLGNMNINRFPSVKVIWPIMVNVCVWKLSYTHFICLPILVAYSRPQVYSTQNIDYLNLKSGYGTSISAGIVILYNIMCAVWPYELKKALALHTYISV